MTNRIWNCKRVGFSDQKGFIGAAEREAKPETSRILPHLETHVTEEIESEFVRPQRDAQAISAVVDLQRWKDVITTNIMLPLDLVEKIVSLMPFPDILNARQLNKSWYCNFSTGFDARAFQSQVTSVSSKWKHYCPVILNLKEDFLMGFDQEHKQWTKIRMGLAMEDANPWSTLTGGAGCLMYVVASGSCKIFVSNILTRTRKWLPSPPNIEPQNAIHLLPSGSDSYRVVLVSKRTNGETGVCCQIYDSQTRSWTVKQSSARISVESSVSAYLNGVLYLMEYIPHQSVKFLAYNVEDETCTNIRTPFGSFLRRTETFKLLVCRSHLMVIIQLHPLLPVFPSHNIHNIRRNTLVVYKLDPVSLHLKEVARGPRTQIIGASSTFCASDNDCIYFGNPQVKSGSVVMLNLQNYEWTCLPPPCPDAYDYKNNRWATFAYQPGINPFISV